MLLQDAPATDWIHESLFPRAVDLSPAAREWLFDRGSMTARLKATFDEPFRVSLRFQNQSEPHLVEAIRLALPPEKTTLIREVDLFCGNLPCLFGRTVFSPALLEIKKSVFERLGTKPLGDILFQDASLRRSQFEFAKLKSGQFEYERACMGFSASPPYLWARRSLFFIQDCSLLLTEVFLMDM